MPINVTSQKPIDRGVDYKLLKEQAETLNSVEIMLRKSKNKVSQKNAELLLGLWNMVQTILDDLEISGECVLASPRNVKRGKR